MSRAWRAFVSGLTGVALTGCGSAVTFDGRRYEKETVAYQVGAVPPGFERVDVDEYDLAFARSGQGTISVNALCEGYDDVPPEALRNHLLFGFTHLEYVREEEWVVDGRSALHSVVNAELDGAPVRADIVLLVKNGCVFDLAYVSGRDAPARSEFEDFVRAFAVERAGPRE